MTARKSDAVVFSLPAARREQRSLALQVVNEEGEPLAQATVQVTGLRSREDADISQGLAQTLRRPNPVQILATDKKGEVSLSVPRDLEDDLKTSHATVLVRHPDFCAVESELDLAEPALVRLVKGFRLTVQALGPNGKTLTGVHAHTADGRSQSRVLEWKPVPDRKSTSALLPTGPHLVRAVVVSPERAPLFSEPVIFHALPDAAPLLRLPVSPGITLRGTLDEPVPRPVHAGRVCACVRTGSPQVSGLVGGNILLDWHVFAPVAPDGSFVLADLPPGELEVTALCDGHVSQETMTSRLPGIPLNRSPMFRRPQIFWVDPGISMVVPMERTGRARVSVLDPDDRPIAHARVDFYPGQLLGGEISLLGTQRHSAGKSPQNADELSTRRPSPFSGNTGSDGKIVIENLPAGLAEFNVSAEGFATPIKMSILGVPQRLASTTIFAGLEAAVSVKMERGYASSLNARKRRKNGGYVLPERLTGANLPVKPSRSFSGRVVDEANQPLSGACVHLWTWSPCCKTKTGTDGTFCFSRLDPDRRIEVCFSADGFSPLHITRQDVGELLQPVVLGRKTFFFGRVSGEGSKPIKDVKIRAITGPKQPEGHFIPGMIYETVADAQGFYRLYVHPDTYCLETRPGHGDRITQTAPIPISAGESIALDLETTRAFDFNGPSIDSDCGSVSPGDPKREARHSGQKPARRRSINRVKKA